MAEAAANLPGQVVEGVESAKFNAIGSGPAFYQNQAYAESLAATQQQNTIRQNAASAFTSLLVAATGKVVKYLTEMDAEESASVTPVTQSAAKSAGTQPPVTVSSPG